MKHRASTMWSLGLLVRLALGAAVFSDLAQAQAVQQRPAGRIVTEAEFVALAARVAELESRPASGAANLDALERRIAALEKKLSGASAPVPTRVPQGKSGWRQLKRGMSMDDVRALLGEPRKVSSGSSYTNWDYDGIGLAHVLFDRDDRVSSWNEP